MTDVAPATAEVQRQNPFTIFMIFLRLGCASFGGPAAHLGYFREEFIGRRRWLDEHVYADLVALCQFLPGPASSQVGVALGLFRGGLPGAFAAWLGFTLPSALVMVLFGLAVRHWHISGEAAWLHGLKVMAVAVVAQAVWAMGRSLCPDRPRATLALAAAILASVVPGVFTQVGIIVLGGLAGHLCFKTTSDMPHTPFPIRLRKRFGVSLLVVVAALLVLLPLATRLTNNSGLQLFDCFYRAGALVFGGGHVVLPVLQAEVVPRGWVSNDVFLAGYGATQAMPGPLFAFAAYLGAVSSTAVSGWLGATVALCGIFLPGFLLIIGTLPLWEAARRHPAMQRAMLGINAAVVGLLLSALHQPVWTSAIHTPRDFALALAAFAALIFWRLPPWLVAIACAIVAGLGW